MIDTTSGELIRVNKRMKAFLGYTEEEWTDQPIRDLFVENDAFE